MALLIRIAILGLSLFAWGCHSKLSNHYDDSIINCGEISRDTDNTLVRLQDPKGQQLGEDVAQFLQAAILHDSQWQKLPVSRRGCVQVPLASKGLLIVEDAVHDDAVTLQLPLPAVSSYLAKLVHRRPASIGFKCPEQGFAADQRLMLNTINPGAVEWKAGVALHVTSKRDDANGTDETVMTKTFLMNDALDLSTQGISLDLAHLAAGHYQLHLQEGYLKYNQSLEALTHITDQPGCPLEIIRSQPATPIFAEAKILIPLARAQVYQALQQPLAIGKEPGSVLEICYEALDPQQSGSACQTTRICKDGSDFQRQDSMILPKPGLWQVFARARDSAQHLSSVGCALVKVSGTAPQFNLQWQTNRAQDFPILKFAPTRLKAQVIGLSHEVLDRWELEQQLECRLTWTTSLGTSRDGRYSRCMSGACMGRTFQGWIPCSSDIDIDMSQEWLRSENAESSVTLSVRASDLSGQQTELSKTLWYSADSLLAKPIAIPEQNEQSQAPRVLIVGEKTLVQFQNHLSSIDSQDPLSLKPDQQLETFLRNRQPLESWFFKDKQGQALWALWNFEQDKQIFGRWEQGVWRFSSDGGMSQPRFSCQQFLQSSQGQLLCLDGDRLAILEEKGSWSEQKVTLDTHAAARCSSYAAHPGSYTETAAGRWYVCSASQLLFQKFGQDVWHKQQPNEQVNQEGLNAVYADSKQRLWLLTRDQNYEWKVFVQEGQGWQESLGPFNLYQNENLEFHEDQQGRVMLGSLVFDSELQKWLPLLPAGIKSTAGLTYDQNGGIWTIGDGRALLRLWPEPFLIPLEQLHIAAGSQITGISQDGKGLVVSFAKTIDGMTLVGSDGLWRIESRPWQDFAFGYTHAPSFGEEWSLATSPSLQGILMTRAQGEIASLEPEKPWRSLSLPNERPDDLSEILGIKWLQSNQYLLLGQHSLWRWDQQNFVAIESKEVLPSIAFKKSVVDASGEVWYWLSSFDQPGKLYHLQQKDWELVPISKDPESCSQLVSVIQGSKLLLDCDSGPIVIEESQVHKIKDIIKDFPDDGKLVAQNAASSSSLFYLYHSEGQQYLARYDFLNGHVKSWLLPFENRLMFRGDVILIGHIAVDQVVLDPTQIERFLVQISGHILRPEGDKLVVAASRRTFTEQKKLPSLKWHTSFDFLSVGRFGEVWILTSDLGLLRYDGIWQGTDPAREDGW